MRCSRSCGARASTRLELRQTLGLETRLHSLHATVGRHQPLIRLVGIHKVPLKRTSFVGDAPTQPQDST